MQTLQTVIGLEVHAQLKTSTKLFCGCSADYFGKAPNTQTCPVCLGLPGALPVLNRQALEYTLRVGLALQCAIPPESRFDRKNYFYPDLPKGYQISQYAAPVCVAGHLDFEFEGNAHRVGIHRVHLEEDAGKLVHAAGGQTQVDLNRAGIPLLEIVTEPDLRSPAQASAFIKALRQLLRYLHVCDGDLEKGSLRCDANISLTRDVRALGTKSEVKNMNSFKAIEDALNYEQARQAALLSAGKKVEQETRGWDAQSNTTVPQRAKEESDDYRYFPEPDLLPVRVHAQWLAAVQQTMPATPAQQRERFATVFGLPAYDIGVLTEEPEVARYFEAVTQRFPKPKEVSNWIMGQMLQLLREHQSRRVRPEDFAEVLALLERGDINRNTAKAVIESAFSSGRSPKDIIREQGLSQISDSDLLRQLVNQVVAENGVEVERYRSGKAGLMGWFVGQVMAKSGGKANPQLVRKFLEEALGAPNSELS